MTEPRDEREVKADVELRTPNWLPGLKLGLSYRRLWDERANGFVRETVELANTNEERLINRINEGDGFADAFQNAAERAIKDGDPVVRDVLKRLIASALHDNSSIHEVSYLLTILEDLQPIHIRILMALDPSVADSDMRHDPSNDGRDMADLAAEVKASPSLIESAMSALENTQFVFTFNGRTATVQLTELGRTLRNLIDEIDGK